MALLLGNQVERVELESGDEKLGGREEEVASVNSNRTNWKGDWTKEQSQGHHVAEPRLNNISLHKRHYSLGAMVQEC